MIDVFLTMYSNLYHFTHFRTGSFDTSHSFLFIFAGRIKRGLTQIFAKNKKVLKHGAAF